MSTLFFTARSGDLAPSDTLENVRSTVTTVNPDADASVATTTPEIGRLETDPMTEGGLTTHNVASQVTPSERFAPSTESRGDHSNALNASISSVGTAAAREAAGQWGHGTAYSQDAMTRIPDGVEFSEEYFQTERRSANGEVTNYMSANGVDNAELTDISEAGKARVAQPNTRDIYQDLYNARMGNS